MHAAHMAKQMADSGHTQHQVTFGQKTAYYTQVMETVFADSIHGLCFHAPETPAAVVCCALCPSNGISGIPSLPAGRNAGGTDTDVLKER